MTTLDFTYLQRYRGFLGWNAFTDGLGNSVPAIEIELYINSYNEPVRKPKPNELNTIEMIDPICQKEIGSAAVFYGAPEVLQMELSGWTITLASSQRWQIFAADGTTSITSSFGNVPYSEIPSIYLTGAVNFTSGGARQRKDPDYFISPMGYKYTSPIISVYQSSYQPGMAKQTFNMTLLLES